MRARQAGDDLVLQGGRGCPPVPPLPGGGGLTRARQAGDDLFLQGGRGIPPVPPLPGVVNSAVPNLELVHFQQTHLYKSTAY